MTSVEEPRGDAIGERMQHPLIDAGIAYVERCYGDDGVDTPGRLADMCRSLTNLDLEPLEVEAIIQTQYNKVGGEPPWTDDEVHSAAYAAHALAHARALTVDDAPVETEDDEPEQLDLAAEVPPLEWQVQSIFATDSVNMLAAHPGSLKTWTLYSMALAIARGTPWLGKYAVKQANVLLLDWEMGKHRVLRRMKKLTRDGRVAGVYYKRNWGSLHDLAFWEKLAAFVRTHNIGAVFYDSLSGGSGGQDENSTVFALPLKFAARIDGVMHVFIHHAKKGESKSNEIARGSSAIQAATDTIYRFTEPQGSAQTSLTCEMKLTRPGEGEQEERIALRLTNASGLERVEREPASGVKDDTLDDLVREIRRRFMQGPIAGGATELAASMNVRKQRVLAAVNVLVSRGEVRRVGRELRLDLFEDRRKRVVESIEEYQRMGEPIAGSKQLADVAHVDVADVERLETEGVIYRMRDGYVINREKNGATT